MSDIKLDELGPNDNVIMTKTIFDDLLRKTYEMGFRKALEGLTEFAKDKLEAEHE